MQHRNNLIFLCLLQSAFLVACINNNEVPKNSKNVLSSPSQPKAFLFDATKAETAGNADWVIDENSNIPQRIPTPKQFTVTSSTGEKYWMGALSSWGIALVKLKNKVETLPAGAPISYDDSGNIQDLSHYDVFVIDEPNIRFTIKEKTALLNFVKNGGGLFMISDHTKSDRNNDGWDSPAIWNDLMNNNPIMNSPFGFNFNLTNISETSSNVASIHNPITNGSQGIVTFLQFNNGATISLYSPAAKGLFWQKGFPQNQFHVMCAYSTYGKGRVVALSDSSPADDGTGANGNKLYNGWTNHSALHLNASLWLAKLQ